MDGVCVNSVGENKKKNVEKNKSGVKACEKEIHICHDNGTYLVDQCGNGKKPFK